MAVLPERMVVLIIGEKQMRRKEQVTVPITELQRFLGMVVQIVYPTRVLTNAGVLPGVFAPSLPGNSTFSNSPSS